MTVDQLVSQYGPIVGIIVAFIASVGAAAVPLAITIANSRVKVSEARAAKEKAEATAIETLSNVTTSFVQLQHTAWERQNDTTQTLITTLAELTLTQKLSAEQAAASGKVIATHMAASNEAQAAVSAASKLASTTIDAAQAKILEDLEALKTSIELLTAAIKKQDIVDDDLREGILERLSRLEEFLQKKVEKAKEKQDEKPNEATPTQTTIELTGLLTSDALGDKPGGGTDK